MTRAFVAVRPPAVVLDEIATRASILAIPDARYTTRHQWHLTLQFLGNDVDVDAVTSALGSLPVAPAEVQLGGSGAPGNPKRGQVFALFTCVGGESLRAVATEIGARLAPIGYEPDARPFFPHLTLARCRRATNMRAAIDAFGREPVGPAWPVDAVTLYESRLGTGPAEYVPRAEIPFVG